MNGSGTDNQDVACLHGIINSSAAYLQVPGTHQNDFYFIVPVRRIRFGLNVIADENVRVVSEMNQFVCFA